MHVLLIGPRASGKTTLGRHLAGAFDHPFIDLDERALARFAQSSVYEVWHAHGEAEWRNAEVRALAEVLAEPDRIVALGGGTPIIPQAGKQIDLARAEGRAIVVYLRWDVAVLMERLHRETGDRPSLTGTDPAAELPAVLAEREPVYRAVADLVWQGKRDMDEDAAARELAAELRKRGV